MFTSLRPCVSAPKYDPRLFLDLSHPLFVDDSCFTAEWLVSSNTPAASWIYVEAKPLFDQAYDFRGFSCHPSYSSLE